MHYDNIGVIIYHITFSLVPGAAFIGTLNYKSYVRSDSSPTAVIEKKIRSIKKKKREFVELNK